MKRILSLLICAMLIISSVGVVGFADNNHWSYDYIKGMIADGVITGDQNGNLNLDNLITRAEFAKTVNKYFGYTVKAEAGFNDVTSDKWYYNDLLIAKGTGYMIGDANGNANADSNITRAEAFVIIARLLGLSDDSNVSFTDEATIPSWAKGKIGALVKEGIVSGYTDGSINANGNITRAEAFVVISKNERHEMPSESTADIDVNGNISSMTHGGSSGGSSGGVSGGSGSGSSKIATIDIRSFNEKTFDIEYSATNFKKVIATLTFETKGNDGELSYDIELEPTKQSGKLYKASLNDSIVDIVGKRGANGESFTLTLATDAKNGYKDSECTYNKKVVADILPELTGFKGGINLENGNYEYKWNATEGITEYVLNVYSDDALTTKVAELSGILNETSVSFDLSAYPLGTAYYVTVAVKNGSFEGIVTSPMAVMAAGVSGGDGSKENPYVISNATQFKNIFDNKNTAASALFEKHYILVSDIDLSSVSYTPALVEFKGSLSGWDLTEDKASNKKINIGTVSTGDFLSSTMGGTTEYTGAGAIFHILNGASVSNLEISGSFTSTKTGNANRHYAGVVVGLVWNNSSLSYIDNTATVTAVEGMAGGVAGCTYKGCTTDNCSNTGNITGTNLAGGIIAANFGSDATITNSYNTGNIEAKLHAGGISGNCYAAVTNCYNTGSVLSTSTSSAGAGGIIGYNSTKGNIISYCWNSGSVEVKSTKPDSAAGGIVGTNYLDVGKNRYVVIENCFNTGVITSASCKGAALGNIYDTQSVIKGFYDNVNKDLSVFGLSKTLHESAMVENAFVLGDRNTIGEYGENIADIWTLSNLKTKNSYFKDSKAWVMDGTYKYPQLKEVPYVGADVILPPPPAYTFTSEVKYQYAPEKSAYTVSWDLDETVTGYSVYVGNEKVADAVTAASFDVPESKIATNTEEITVSAIFEGQEYFSDPITLYYGGGKGTEEDPYLVYTIGHLNNVKLNLDAEFKQMQDISEELTTPIGSPTAPFTGKYYGADESNKSVNLKISGGNFLAMFSATKGATIEYITTKGSVSGDGNEPTTFIMADGKTERKAYATAALVALTLDGAQTNISNCINEASVSVATKADKTGAYTGVGGIGGYPMSANFTNCSNYGIINAGGTSNVGGIAGYAGDGAVTYCKNYGLVTNGASLGGIVGALYIKTFEYNANIGPVENPKNIQHTGGLVGSICGNSSVKNSYNSGKVTGGNNTGAITGRVYASASSVTEISNCFNTGAVSGTKQAIAFADYTRGKTLTVKNIYDTANSKIGVWATNSSLTANQKADPKAEEGVITVSNSYVLNGTNLTNGGTAITEEELKALLTSDTTFSGDIWYLDETTAYAYPELKAVKYEKVETIDAITLTVDTSDDKFVLNWNLQEGISYDVCIGGEKVATVLTNSYDATDYILGEFSGDVYVVGNKEGVSPSVSNTVAVNGLFAGGTGAEADPYLVANAKHFKNIAKYPSAFYKQTKDIEGVTDIISVAFKGQYDGNGKSIDFTLVTSDATVDGFGLFSQAGSDDAPVVIKNLTITGSLTSTSTQRQNVGALVGTMSGDYLTIEGCVNYATINAEKAGGNSNIAGLLGRGYKNNIYVKNCANYGNVAGGGSAYVGGVVGMAGNTAMTHSVVENCANYGEVSGKTAGGVMAWTYANISGCFNMGTVTASSATVVPAGIVAYTGGKSITVENCFNAGKLVMTGTLPACGILASNHKTDSSETITVINCYNTFDGAVIAGVSSSGKLQPIVQNSYNVTTTDTKQGVTVVTLEQLKTTEISDGYTLLSGNGSNEDYNKDYEYPQIKNNLVPKDFVVPGFSE